MRAMPQALTARRKIAAGKSPGQKLTIATGRQIRFWFVPNVNDLLTGRRAMLWKVIGVNSRGVHGQLR
jgi:hypothetical protein